ncbi:MAG: FlhC family transcriptional regulator [Proteobacteria bacterium]|nr:FlhC family transcriptional regulator [Pseudomonadota bacterium]
MSLRLRCSEAPVVGFGARLQAAERLIRLGARASVVVDALDADVNSRALIRRMYVGIRGPGRPRGPLPFDHVELLGTVAARMDASIFLDAWQRLRDAGSPRGMALAGAWECLEAVRTPAARAGRVLGIDQCWILARSLEHDALRRVCCERCSSTYFDAHLRPRRPGQPAAMPAPVAPARQAHQRCPHCAMAQAGVRRPGGPVRGALVRRDGRTAQAPRRRVRSADSATRTAAPHPLAELAQRYAWAEALFREGARPPIVTHVTGLAMTGTLRQLFIEVVGHGPRQGALPQLGEHIVATYARKLQSSVVVVIADRLVRAGYGVAPTLLATWHTYRALFGASARFDINAVALVLRARHHPDFTLVYCRGCCCAYLELRLDVPGSRCPVCRSLGHAQMDAART